jgi:hypothetical protein
VVPSGGRQPHLGLPLAIAIGAFPFRLVNTYFPHSLNLSATPLAIANSTPFCTAGTIARHVVHDYRNPMGRKTRAAARAQEMPDEAPQTEEACGVPLPPTPSKQHERGPPSSIVQNIAEGADAETLSGESNDMPKLKGKKGKRAGGKKKGKKGKGGTSDEPELVDGAVANSLEVEGEAEEGDESSATSGSPLLHQGSEEDEKNGKLSHLQSHSNMLNNYFQKNDWTTSQQNGPHRLQQLQAALPEARLHWPKQSKPRQCPMPTQLSFRYVRMVSQELKK